MYSGIETTATTYGLRLQLHFYYYDNNIMNAVHLSRRSPQNIERFSLVDPIPRYNNIIEEECKVTRVRHTAQYGGYYY